MSPAGRGSYLSGAHELWGCDRRGERQRYSARSFRDGESNTVNLLVTTSPLPLPDSGSLLEAEAVRLPQARDRDLHGPITSEMIVVAVFLSSVEVPGSGT
jgi:hypothetical protein